MSTTKDTINTWLRDAHATETQAETMLRGTASRNADYAQFSDLLNAEADKSDARARSLEACLVLRGSNTSSIKDAAAKVTAMGQALSGMFVGDEVVKAALATTTFARMQAASMRVLVAAVLQENDQQTADSCGALVEAHEGFANEIDSMLPNLTTEYLVRETDGSHVSATSAGSN